jgi:iron complex transport system ATP-binding protein
LVLAEIRKRAARGTGIILSTHDPDQAFAVASRVAQGGPLQVLTAARLKAVYGIDVPVERLAGGQTVRAPVYPR